MPPALPDGLLVTWYGDDFTGSAAVMEALTFAGLPAVLFFDTPTPAQQARFNGMRGLGIASTARSHGPDWMAHHMPAPLGFLAGLDAPYLHYKVCSTLDSAPEVGNIGCAVDLALQARPSTAVPVVIAAPQMRRYQAFGHLFAGTPDGVFRLDRHPVMAQHPVTPMAESDVLRHLARQSALPSALITLEQLGDPDTANDALLRAMATGARLIGMDNISAQTDIALGRLIWENRDACRVLVGSQGVEYALIAYWQAAGMIPPAPASGSAGAVGQVVVMSGSVSPITAAQIAWSAANGFGVLRMDAAALLQDPARVIDHTAAAAMAVLATGQSPLVCTATGPDDPAVAAFRAAVAHHGLASADANQRIGVALGHILDRVLRQSGLRRAVISGGDTSGHAARQLGLFALQAIAPTIPGAALFRACGDGLHDGLELALKGGQMGSPDYFGWIRAGGGARAPL